MNSYLKHVLMLTRLNILVCGNTRLVLILIILTTSYLQDNHSIFDSGGSRGGSKGVQRVQLNQQFVGQSGKGSL